jgi:TIR domain
MAAKVFISYRREDSAGYAGRIHDRLVRELGADLLFIDVDSVPLGVNFVNVLRDEVAKCSVLLAVIGRDWLDVRDENGRRRLDNPNDFVRVEVAAALQRDIPVIPILLEGARVPSADRLPKDLHELSLRNGVFVRHSSFHNDMDRLIRGLGRQSGRADAEPMLASLASQPSKETMALEGLVTPQKPEKPAEPAPTKPAEPTKAAVSTPQYVNANVRRPFVGVVWRALVAPSKIQPYKMVGFIGLAILVLLAGMIIRWNSAPQSTAHSPPSEISAPQSTAASPPAKIRTPQSTAASPPANISAPQSTAASPPAKISAPQSTAASPPAEISTAT